MVQLFVRPTCDYNHIWSCNVCVETDEGGIMVDNLRLRLSGDAKQVRESFLEWRSILTDGSDEIGSAMQINGTDVRFSQSIQKELLILHFSIGSSVSKAVELNQPRKAGSENPGTTIAVDGKGRRYVVRQGDLHSSPSSQRIKGAEFTRRTGLHPVTMWVGSSQAKKEWHVVARLDGRSNAAILNDTTEFVRRCWNARTFGLKAAEDQVRLTALFGHAERGGWYDVDPRLLPTRVLKVQGYVSECLATVLQESGISLVKPRHAANYEVDGTVDAPDGPILIEIKTGISAADIYCGVGQLTVYPLILPDLAAHTKILLLPGRPRPGLVKALEDCGVELHSYELKRGRRRATALFATAFLRRCGMPEWRIADLVARRKALP